MALTETTLIQHYTRFLLWPVIIAALFHIVALHTPNTTLLVIVTHLLLVVVISIHSSLRHIAWKNAAVAGGLSGAVVAAIAGLYKLFNSFNVVTAFNLFTEPVLTGIIDEIATGAITLVTTWILHKLHQRPTPSSTTNN